jgi:hypothetical protein
MIAEPHQWRRRARPAGSCSPGAEASSVHAAYPSGRTSKTAGKSDVAAVKARTIPARPDQPSSAERATRSLSLRSRRVKRPPRISSYRNSPRLASVTHWAVQEGALAGRAVAGRDALGRCARRRHLEVLSLLACRPGEGQRFCGAIGIMESEHHAGTRRPIFPDSSANQSAPSGPVAIPYGPEAPSGSVYSLITTCVSGPFTRHPRVGQDVFGD